MWRLVKAELAYRWWQILGLLILWVLGLRFFLGSVKPGWDVPVPGIVLFTLWFLMLAMLFSMLFLNREKNENRLKLYMTLPVSHSDVFLSRAIPMTALQLIASSVALFVFSYITLNGAVINSWMVLSATGFFLFNLYSHLFQNETRFIRPLWGVASRILVILFTFSIIFTVGFWESTRPYAWKLLSQPLGTMLCALLAVAIYMIARALFLKRETFIERG